MKTKQSLRAEDVKKREVQEVGPPAETDRLMSAGLERDGGLTDPMYCVRWATSAEWKILRDLVAARKALEPEFSWWTCSKCGRGQRSDFGQVARNAAKPGGQACLSCNWQGYKDGGFLRRMTAAEVRRFEDNEKAANAAAVLKLEKQSLFSRNESRGRAGLEPMTLEEFRADRKSEWDQARRDDRKLAQDAAARERGRTRVREAS